MSPLEYYSWAWSIPVYDTNKVKTGITKGVSMMMGPRQRGFTLVEMLVVIAIIVILMSIIFPVMNSARASARKTKCIAQLHQLAVALKGYRSDFGRFPPRPVYNTTRARYVGGFSSLWDSRHLDETTALVCPDDWEAIPLTDLADKVYSSYNGKAKDLTQKDWVLSEVYYNFHGYTAEGLDQGTGNDAAYYTALMKEYKIKGLRKRQAPRLDNRSAPDNTIITHCRYHRGDSTDENDQTELVVRLGGSTDTVKLGYLKTPGGATNIAPFVSQLK